MEAEAALYWRTVCKHLQSEAHVSENEYIQFSHLVIFISATQEKSRGMFCLILFIID